MLYIHRLLINNDLKAIEIILYLVRHYCLQPQADILEIRELKDNYFTQISTRVCKQMCLSAIASTFQFISDI